MKDTFEYFCCILDKKSKILIFRNKSGIEHFLRDQFNIGEDFVEVSEIPKSLGLIFDRF